MPDERAADLEGSIADPVAQGFLRLLEKARLGECLDQSLDIAGRKSKTPCDFAHADRLGIARQQIENIDRACHRLVFAAGDGVAGHAKLC